MATSATSKRVGSSGGRAGRRAGVAELLVGSLLLAAAALVGLELGRRSWLDRLDQAGFRLFPAHPGSIWAGDLAHAGSVIVLCAGVVVLCVSSLLRRDWVRALTLPVAPIAAVVVVERVAKPLIGHGLEGVPSYPSGTVTVVAALVAGAFVAAPRALRPLVALVGGALILVVSVAVIVLRWHYPSDAAGGVCVGAGSVFFADGCAQALVSRRNR